MSNFDLTDPTQPIQDDHGRFESPRAHHALLDYLHLGPGRTLIDLLNHYRALDSAPTHSYASIRYWSSHYAWSARAISYDNAEAERAQVEDRARRDAILKRGLALEHERIERLNGMYQKLDALSITDEAIWIKDVKALRLENNRVERVELRRFNGELIRHMRGLLDDIATETGGRSHRPRPLDQAKEPTIHLEDYSLDALSPAEQEEFIRLQNMIFSPSESREQLP